MTAGEKKTLKKIRQGRKKVVSGSMKTENC